MSAGKMPVSRKEGVELWRRGGRRGSWKVLVVEIGKEDGEGVGVGGIEDTVPDVECASPYAHVIMASRRKEEDIVNIDKGLANDGVLRG
jgi:hypothetical protein